MAALIEILLMTIELMGIIYRAERRFLLIEPDSALMLITYFVGVWLLFHIGLKSQGRTYRRHSLSRWYRDAPRNARLAGRIQLRP